MRIASHSVSENIVRQVQRLSTQQAKLQNQVGTGLRISQPEDDPAAVARVLNIESEQRRTTQYRANSARAMEMSNAAFSGLRNMKQVSDRTAELATLGGGVLGPDASKTYATELGQLIEQTLQQANSRFGNDYLYAGTATSTPPFVAVRDANGEITSVSYAGNMERAEVPISESTSITPGTSGETNQKLGDFINQMVALKNALEIGNHATIQTIQGDLVVSEDAIVSSLAEHGGVQTRIEANKAQMDDRKLSLETLVSSETDADMPETIVRLNQTQNAYQAALQSAANILKISLLDYIR